MNRVDAVDRVRVLLLAIMLLASACSSGSDAEPDAEPGLEPAPSSSQQPRPTSNIVVSDAVPTIEELREMGIGEQAAECFIATIDPQGTGRVASAELFVEAFGACM